MISDNGTSFIGAERKLRDLVNSLAMTKMRWLTVNRGVLWKFNPPSAPRFNGLHKILVKAAKKAMFQVMSKAALTAEELTTTIVGAEGMMNSRAFNYQSSNTGDPEPLTPKHFLINQVGGQFAPESVDNEPYNPRVWSRYVQEIFHQFWKMFERMASIPKSKKEMGQRKACPRSK